MADGGQTVPRITKAEHVGPDDTGDNIEAKRVVNYVWNSSTEAWERGTGEAVTYATRIATDSGDANVSYIGKAAIGSPTSTAVWQIRQVDETSGTVITFADGDANFNNIWDNRESLSYS